MLRIQMSDGHEVSTGLSTAETMSSKQVNGGA